MARGTWQGGGTWQTSGGGGGGLVLVVIGAALAVGSGAASAAASALVTIVAIVAGCVTGLAVLGGVAWLVHRARSGPARSDRPGQAINAPVVSPVGPAARRELSEPYKPAIGPARETHLHFHVSAAELAAIMRRYDGED